MEFCLNKQVKTNNKMMTHYVEVQSQIVTRRVEEMNAANEKLEKLAAEQANSNAAPVEAPVV